MADGAGVDFTKSSTRSAACRTSDLSNYGYPEIRAAMIEALGICVSGLAAKDFELAYELLDCIEEDLRDEEAVAMTADTALFTRPLSRSGRRPRKRAIDRLAAKAFKKADPLVAAIAAKMRSAIFSMFEIEAASAGGEIKARDLLDDGRLVTIMDLSLSKSASTGMLICGRFVDVGKWHVGFGIATPLRKSEALAVTIGLSIFDELETKRAALCPLVYHARLHDVSLVHDAVSPLIDLLAAAIDAGAIDVEESINQFARQVRPLSL